MNAQGDGKSPMEYIQEAEPILVEGPVVASRGSEWARALVQHQKQQQHNVHAIIWQHLTAGGRPVARAPSAWRVQAMIQGWAAR